MKTDNYFAIQHRQQPERRFAGLLIALVVGLTPLELFAQGEGQKERNAPPPPLRSKESEGNASMNKRYTRNDPALAVLPAPASTNGVPDLVAKEWIIEAVRQIANTRWTTFAIGTPIPCSDIEGHLIFYQVPVAIDTNAFPTPLTPPGASEISSSDLLLPELWGVGDYWTFDVSARRSYYPVPHYGGGLPPFLVTYHKAVELAQKRLNDSHVQVARYCVVGLDEEYYDLVTPSGGRVLINARNLRCQEIQSGVAPFAASDVTKRNAAASVTIENRESLKRDYQRQAGEAWDRISNNIQKGN
jgi:hypothetical protein